MARLYYSLAGEGFGHATRVHAVVEALKQEHDIVIHAPGQAYDWLATLYHDSAVRIKKIPGMRFHYKANHCLSYSKSFCYNLPYILQIRSLIKRLRQDIESDAPDLVITDFEPALPRAAKKAGVPFIGLDHQHILSVCDLSVLPFSIRRYAECMSPMIDRYYSGQEHTIVSSFHFLPLKTDLSEVSTVGTLLRPAIVEAKPETGQHVLVYLRRNVRPELLQSLAQAGCPMRIYGLGEQPSQEHLTFCPVDRLQFIEDLATSRAVICTAGNQLISETLYLGKPILSFPEEGNQEQRLHNFLLDLLGMGMTREIREITDDDIRTFLDYPDRFIAQVDKEAFKGNDAALKIIQRYLPKTG